MMNKRDNICKVKMNLVLELMIKKIALVIKKKFFKII
jgi:hypothetical protein